MKTAVIVQARMGSKRFPGKVMAMLNGKPVLQHVIERCQRIGPDVIIATPDYKIFDYAQEHGVDCFMGSEHDVLGRYYLAAVRHDIDLIMRITADCPLIQPELCRQVLDLYRAGACRFAAIGWPKTYPKGYGCEVFSKYDLCLAHELADRGEDREHVTPWMERNLACEYLTQDKDESHLNYCVDYPEDIARLEMLQSRVWAY